MRRVSGEDVALDPSTFQSAFFIAVHGLVTGLTRDPEFYAQGSHAFPIFQPNHKAYAFVYQKLSFPGGQATETVYGRSPCHVKADGSPASGRALRLQKIR